MNTNSLILSTRPESSVEIVSEGIHLGLCTTIADIGHQYSEKFEVTQRKLIIGFVLPELPKLTVERDNKRIVLPRGLSRRFTASLHEKANLRHFLEAWRGRRFTEAEIAGFDVAKLLNQPAQLQVLHAVGAENKRFANIVNALPVSKGTKVPSTGEVLFFSVGQLQEPTLPPNLPEWIGRLAMQSREWERLAQRNNTAAQARTPISESARKEPESDNSDDVPF
jgi:hypothetical protein